MVLYNGQKKGMIENKAMAGKEAVTGKSHSRENGRGASDG